MRGTHEDAVGHTGDGDESSRVVSNVDGVHGRGTTQVHGGRRRRDRSLPPRADVGGVELGADRVGLLAGVRFARVDRAKGLLMKNMGMSEPEAFRWIQKTSMDRRLSMREVADAVINQVDD